MLTFVLGTSGYQDVSKDGTKFSMVLSKYGATDVYYNIIGPDKEHKFGNYYKRIIDTGNGAPTKVNNISESNRSIIFDLSSFNTHKFQLSSKRVLKT